MTEVRVAGGITKMWEERCQDAVAEGSILIGVHRADARMVEQAVGLLQRRGPHRVDSFDAEGRPIGGDAAQDGDTRT